MEEARGVGVGVVGLALDVVDALVAVDGGEENVGDFALVVAEAT